MRLLLDQGLPYSTAQILRDRGIDTRHVGELDMARASDEAILEYARRNGYAVVTLDGDFHALLAHARVKAPSTVRIRMQRLRAPDAADVISRVLARVGPVLEAGVAVTVTSRMIRIRSLPIGDGS